jgi:hypothetical protein
MFQNKNISILITLIVSILLNSYLQTLFHISGFRRLILHLDTQSFPSYLTVVHLQKLFNEMKKPIPEASLLDIIESFE